MAVFGSYLFSDHDLRNIINEKWKEILEEINIKDRVTLSNINLTELIEYFKDKYALHLPILKEDARRVETEDIRMRIKDYGREVIVDGIQITYFIPFEGDYHILHFSPMSSVISNTVKAVTYSNEILLTYQKKRSANHLELIKNDFEREISIIRSNLEAMVKDIDSFNSSIPAGVANRYNDRIAKIIEDNKKMEELGFPIRRREDVPSFLDFPQRRRVITFPKPSEEGSFSEPAIQMGVYNEILDILRHMSLTMERNPATFREMGEVNIRDIFLVMLNSLFEGQATGETFNLGGKTDILVRVQDRNVFIGECKFWNGPKSLLNAIDQLLDYTSWSDTKTAIILFNKTKDFTSVLDKIPSTVRSHPNFLKELEKSNESEFRFKVHHKDDRSRELFLTILAFEVPIEAPS